MVRVRIGEGEQPQPKLLWDTVWFPDKGAGDWALAGPGEVGNVGGLQARAAIHTAVVLLLFTDKRIPDQHYLRYLVEDGDPRGWFGDGVDVQPERGEAEMGSLLWVFERAHLNDTIVRWVEVEALAALEPLLRQKVASKIDAQATRGSDPNRCNLAVQIYGKDRQQVYSERFEDLWQQTVTAPRPLGFPSFPPLVGT